MPEVTKIIIPILYGVVGVFLVGWIVYIFWWVAKKLGMISFFVNVLGRKKISDEIYEEVSLKVGKGEKFKDIVQYVSKFPEKIQEKYFQAYREIIKLKGEIK